MKINKIILYLVLLGVIVGTFFIAVKYNEIKTNKFSTTTEQKSNDSYSEDYFFEIEGNPKITGVFSYTSKEKDFARLSVDIHTYDLKKTDSISGIKFVNQDESIIFFIKGEGATFEVKGERVYNISKLERASILNFIIRPNGKDCEGIEPFVCDILDINEINTSLKKFNFGENPEFNVTVAVIDNSKIYKLVRVLYLNQ